MSGIEASAEARILIFCRFSFFVDFDFVNVDFDLVYFDSFVGILRFYSPQHLIIIERSKLMKLAGESIPPDALRLQAPVGRTRHFDSLHPAISEVSFASPE